MTYRRFLIFTIVVGIIFIVLLYNYFHQGLAIIIALFSILVVGLGFVVERAFHKTDSFVEQYGEADILNRMWFPLQDELTDVVKNRGRVTEAASAWTTAPGLSKRETPRAFYRGMEEYVGQRKFVASLVEGDLATEESQQQLMAEQQRLLLKAQGLLESVDKEIEAIPGSETIVRRTRRARPRPAAQRTRSAATRPSSAATQPTRVYRSAQAQAPTPARTIRERSAPSRPAPATLRITETPTLPEPTVAPPAPRVPVAPSTPSPRPAPSRITDTPAPPEPTVTPPAPRAPGPPPPPTVPSAPSPVIASTAPVSEPVEPVKQTVPNMATPVPSEPEPHVPPSEPPANLRLDVASVCEDLFNSNMMSYATNRLFDDKYKDTTVRWKGTARRASAYSYDFEFGDGGGTKAELDLYEIKQQYGSRTVKAFVQLPVEAADEIGARIGEDIEFEGRLLTCEGSARRLYIADARMVK